MCDQAAGEVCPTWPGRPMTAHWGIHDPAAVEGADEERSRAFNRTFRELDARLKIFTSLCVATLSARTRSGQALQRERRRFVEGTGLSATVRHPGPA